MARTPTSGRRTITTRPARLALGLGIATVWAATSALPTTALAGDPSTRSQITTSQTSGDSSSGDTPIAENSANASWIIDLYPETLGRDADEAGIDFWVSRLAGGGAPTRERVAKSFVYSPEGSGIEVDRAYGDLLGRAPDAGGHAFWTEFLQRNPVTVLRSNLISSDEYFETSGGTNGTWLDQVYNEVLERKIDVGGLAYWNARLEAGEPRWTVVWSVYLSAESLQNRADAYAREILGRELTDDEQSDAVALIKAEDERALRARLLASDEAFEPYLDAVGLLTAAGDR